MADDARRVVLVTGGTRGIGRHIAARFDRDGFDVVVAGRRQPDQPVVGTFCELDVRDPDAVATAVDGVVAERGRLDVVINNAGGSPFALAADASPKFHTKIIELNLLGPLHVAQAARPHLAAADDGCIVNIASVSGTRPSPGTAAYGAAKAGLINLTRTLAVEWAPDVRVNAVVAGLVRTEQAHLHYGDADGIARVEATIPAGRMATGSDIAGACAFLASADASYVTGASLVVDGGGERPAYLEAANPDQS